MDLAATKSTTDTSGNAPSGLASVDEPSPPSQRMPLLPISSPETIQKCAALPLLEGDVFLCSYPKSGTTWLQHIVLSLLRAHSNDTIPPYQHVSDYAPFFEIDPHWEGDDLAPSIRENHRRLGRRVFNTHLRWDMLPSIYSNDGTDGGSCSKFIYIVRSPLDACVSFFHHLSHQVEGGYEGSFDEFFRDWLDGKIAFGSWIDHVLSYVPAFANYDPIQSRSREGGREFFILTFEELVQDLPNAVNKLVEFLQLTVAIEKQKELLPTFSFEHMTSQIDRFQPRSVTWKKQFSFLRQGQIGGSRSIVTEEQRRRYAHWMEKRRFEETLSRSLGRADLHEVFRKITHLLQN